MPVKSVLHMSSDAGAEADQQHACQKLHEKFLHDFMLKSHDQYKTFQRYILSCNS